MAQLGSAQREPSMEEILASIRRIIEDSDGVRKPDEETSTAETDHGAMSHLQAANTETPSAPPRSVIDVDVFRAGLHADTSLAGRSDASPATPRPIPVERPASAERSGEREVPRPIFENSFSRGPAKPAATYDAQSSAVPADVTTAASLPTSSDWRLGIPEPLPTAGNEPEDVDIGAVADALLQDMSDAQTELERASDAVETATVSTEMTLPPIISGATGKQVAAAFGELSEALAARNRKSLEEMAEDMLRPMLQDWLDNNLPTLVERLVRAEIERVARGS